MTTTVAVFTRDLRIRDNPMLAAAVREAELVVPLFVLDEHIDAAPGRRVFLADSLADLDRSLRELGGGLVLRTGDPAEQVRRVAEQVDAARVHIASDVSGYARRREQRLRAALGRRELCCHDDVHTVLPPGAAHPQSKDHFAVFTPYYRRWTALPRRRVGPAPDRLRLPSVEPGRLPETGRGRFPGGERAGRERADRWLREGLPHYERRHDLLAEDGTSRLSPYLHFGCVSALELANRADRAGGEAFVRQLAWRDFHHQVLAACPEAAHRDYRNRGDAWLDDSTALDAWRTGHTGIPIVDAGMRQLRAEGWMHNRARLITGSFLTKTLYLDWRAGAAHFFDWLLDGDVANNCLNWQWVAGTGTDTRPNRVLNPLRQARRYDPDGEYVRRYVAELADVPGDVHEPWRLPAHERRALRYPEPIVDLVDARTRFLAART
jgi:deoxyribodipyrimidine photo-lyase